MKTLGLDLPDNCTLKFNANGIEVRASLNVPKDLFRFLFKGNVHKAPSYLVYSLKYQVNSENVSAKNIRKIYDYLLNNAMRNVREAKRKSLKSQIKNLKATQIKIDF